VSPRRVTAANAPATQPVKTVPGVDTAEAALKASPRHGEWVEIPLADGKTKLKTWVVYPERKDRAPVVLVIFDIYGMGPWPQVVADQLAAEGFVGVAPDLVSGMGPNGGGSESFTGAGTGGVGAA